MSFIYTELSPEFIDDGSRLAEAIKSSVRVAREKAGLEPDPRAEPMDPKELEDRADRFVYQLSKEIEAKP